MSTQNSPSPASAHFANEGRTTTLGEQTRKVAEDVRELGSLAMAGAGEALQSVKDRASETAESVRERARESLDQGKQRLVQARDGFEDYVSTNPFKSMLIAAGIGALIGYSLRSRG
jgi:ElaB/YqjD/DUF883 family membrane-anchored ribosome-binding protein